MSETATDLLKWSLANYGPAVVALMLMACSGWVFGGLMMYLNARERARCDALAAEHNKSLVAIVERCTAAMTALTMVVEGRARR